MLDMVMVLNHYNKYLSLLYGNENFVYTYPILANIMFNMKSEKLKIKFTLKIHISLPELNIQGKV